MPLRVGDLIKIPLTDRIAALGQVVVKKHRSVLVLAVFPAADASHDEDLRGQLAKEPQLVVETSAPIDTGDWSVFGHAPVGANIPIPVYVVPVGLDRVFYIQDINGKLLRPATAVEIDLLRMPASFSPTLVEDAARAANDLGEWHTTYDAMRADWERSAGRVLGTSGQA